MMPEGAPPSSYRRVLLGPSILASPSSERQASRWGRLTHPQHRGYAADIGGPALGQLSDRRRLSRTRPGPRHRCGYPRPRPGQLGRPPGWLGRQRAPPRHQHHQGRRRRSGRPVRDPGPRTGGLRRAGRTRRLFAVGSRGAGPPGRRGRRPLLLPGDRAGRADRARRGGRHRRQPHPDGHRDHHRPPRDRRPAPQRPALHRAGGALGRRHDGRPGGSGRRDLGAVGARAAARLQQPDGGRLRQQRPDPRRAERQFQPGVGGRIPGPRRVVPGRVRQRHRRHRQHRHPLGQQRARRHGVPVRPGHGVERARALREGRPIRQSNRLAESDVRAVAVRRLVRRAPAARSHISVRGVREDADVGQQHRDHRRHGRRGADRRRVSRRDGTGAVRAGPRRAGRAGRSLLEAGPQPVAASPRRRRDERQLRAVWRPGGQKPRGAGRSARLGAGRVAERRHRPPLGQRGTRPGGAPDLPGASARSRRPGGDACWAWPRWADRSSIPRIGATGACS